VIATTTIDLRGFAFLLLDALVVGAIVLRPFTRNYDDSDKGSGNLVVLPAPLKPSYIRCAIFFVTSFVISAFILGLKSPNLSLAYHNLVTQMLLSVIPDPPLVNGYVHSLIPVFQVSVLAFGVAFALAYRASVGRRIMIFLNVMFFLVVSAIVETFFGIFVIKTGFPLGPTPIVDLLVQYLIAGVVVCRVALTTFQLPKSVVLPLRRGHDLKDDLVVIICVLCALAVTTGGAVYLIGRFGHNQIISVTIAFACPSYVLTFTTLFLGFIRLVHPRRIHPTDERPPVEVIIPAYNEEICIADLLRSLDEAAETYGGPVRVVLCDDGSLDNTRLIASEVMASYRYATGEIIEGTHTGKSGALNAALAVCVQDIVYRVDADCIVQRDCFLYSVPHFLANPKVGIMGAFTLPKEPYTTWFDRMRMFELVVGFGVVRPASDVVDGIACIPGTFTAFRRQAALEVDGFIEGMYGEDLEFTCAIARAGYRAVIDTRVRSFEDVPNTQRQMRIQRTRWNRGSTMVFSRYVPFATGLAGPRFWFFSSRAAAKRFLVPLHFTTFMAVIALAVFHPTSHLNILELLFLLFFRAAPALVLLIIASIYYGQGKRLAWVPVRYLFIILKHYYGLEAFLGFSYRPILTNRVREVLRLPPLPPRAGDRDDSEPAFV
jgi:cellulose synthase/poly-beta-1,6-N-acetylglucosamine synthase-like glycosyltransferase